MDVDVNKVVEVLGEAAVEQVGESVGLDGEKTAKVVKSFANHAKGGGDIAARVAADTELQKDVVSQFMDKLVEVGKDKLLAEGPIADALKATGPVGGIMGKLFGKK